MKRFQFLGCVLGAALSFLANGQVQILSDPPSVFRPRTISGIVRDPAGASAAGAIISVHPGHYIGQPEYAEARTDKSGQYKLLLQPNKLQNFDGVINETNCILARDLRRNLVAVQEFREKASIDLSLQAGVTLSGLVLDNKGAPVSNALVEIGFYAGPFGYRLGPQPLMVDAQGKFAFPALPQGRQYFLQCRAKGYAMDTRMLSAKFTETNQFKFTATVLKTAGLKLAGVVMDPNGKPFAGATVNLNGLGQPEWSTTVSDATGHFAFAEVCDGPVNLSAYWNSPGAQWGFTGNGDGNKAQAGDTDIVIRLRVWGSPIDRSTTQP